MVNQKRNKSGWKWALFTLALVSQSARAVTIDTVRVGNPGNAPDPLTGFGSVAGNYRIGTYEVTNAQYVEFLNAVDPTGANSLGLYDQFMTSDAVGGVVFNSAAPNASKYAVKAGRGNNPVVLVSWYDSIRFANWLHNGQGSGGTESGAYTLLGGTPAPSNGNSITRNPAAKWWLPSEGEWYKAAYHKNDGVTANYWLYPTSTDDAPFSDEPPGSDAPDPSNTANYFADDFVVNQYDNGYAVTESPDFMIAENYLANVGAYTLSNGPYGTFDQGGNVWEWNEALVDGSFRGLRGNSWGSGVSFLRASSRIFENPSYQHGSAGFRVATISVLNNGDYNSNGIVDAADYVVWRKNDGTESGYDIWRANFGEAISATGGGADASVLNGSLPEPSALALCTVLSILLGCVKIHRTR